MLKHPKDRAERRRLKGLDNEPRSPRLELEDDGGYDALKEQVPVQTNPEEM